MAKNAIEIKGLHKTYRSKDGNEKAALNSVDLTIKKGAFYGLLGPNGAGKSTLINILANTVLKTSGEVSINGFNIDTHRRSASRSIGVVPQELVLDPFFPPVEVLDNMAGFYGIPKAKRKTMEIIKAVGLEDKAYSYARKLSGGMRRRLLVAKAMVHSPEVLILDEPTAGVDVELRRQLWSYVIELNKKGTTILLTTHYLEEAEELCDHIAVINHGNIIANDSKKNIMKIMDQKCITISPSETIKKVPNELKKYNASITEEGAIAIHYQPSSSPVENIIAAFKKTGFTIRDLSTKEADLEDIFTHLTNK